VVVSALGRVPPGRVEVPSGGLMGPWWWYEQKGERTVHIRKGGNGGELNEQNMFKCWGTFEIGHFWKKKNRATALSSASCSKNLGHKTTAGKILTTYLRKDILIPLQNSPAEDPESTQNERYRFRQKFWK
jgi:hypothetical protein